jgi:hypothetical protein
MYFRLVEKMKKIVLIFINLIVMSGLATVTAQPKYRSDKKKLEKFIGLWSASAGRNTVQLSLTLREKVDLNGFIFVDRIEGYYLLLDSTNKVIFGNPKETSLIGYLDRKNAAVMTGIYLDDSIYLLAEARFEFDKASQTFRLEMNNPNQGSVIPKLTGEPYREKQFKFPTGLTFRRTSDN